MAQKSIPATAPQSPPSATRRTQSRATTRRRVAWRPGRVSPAAAFPILYVLALALARVVVVASRASDAGSDGLGLAAALAAFLAAAAWLAALAIYARWIWRRFASMGRQPWRLGLIAQGLSNREIGARLFLALDTIKGHNRKIFDKLQVQRRTEAIARARELGLL